MTEYNVFNMRQGSVNNKLICTQDGWYQISYYLYHPTLEEIDDINLGITSSTISKSTNFVITGTMSMGLFQVNDIIKVASSGAQYPITSIISYTNSGITFTSSNTTLLSTVTARWSRLRNTQELLDDFMIGIRFNNGGTIENTFKDWDSEVGTAAIYIASVWLTINDTIEFMISNYQSRTDENFLVRISVIRLADVTNTII